MQRHVLLRLVLVGGLLGCSGGIIPEGAGGQDPSQRVKDPKETRLIISDESLILNGQTVVLPVPVQEFIKLLGKPTRESRRVNTILTWDELGIYVYVEPKSEKINAINIEFRKESYAFTPEKVFAGKVTIGATDVTADSTIESINATRKGKAFENNRPSMWTGELGNLLLFIATPRDGKHGIVYLSIAAREQVDALAIAPGNSATATELDAKPQAVAADNLLGQLEGDWVVDGFVIGGGEGGVSVSKCGSVMVAPARDQSVSISVSCKDAGDYTFRLKHGSGSGAYLMTVKSKYGVSIEDFPLEHVDHKDWLGTPIQDGKVWLGTRDQLVDKETLSVTAMMGRIEGRNWRGWTIQVLPTEATNPGVEALKKPYFKVDLTRRK